MNINTVNSNNVSMQGRNNPKPGWFKRKIRYVEQKILDMSKTSTSKEGKNSVQRWDKTAHWVSHPMWNRGIIGATALLTQPAIDYYNHRVDEDTRTVSRNRTIAKIVAGTLVGMFVVRGPVYKLVEKLTNPQGNSKWSKLLLPKDRFQKLLKDCSSLDNYRSAVSMLAALGVMIVTNFVLDVPLTILFTNLLNKQSGIVMKKDDNDAQSSKKLPESEVLDG